MGGAEEVLVRLVAADPADEHVVIGLTAEGIGSERLRALGVRVTALGMPRGRVTLRGLRALYRSVRAEQPDVVQTWMYHADLIGGCIARLAGVRRLVWGVHNGDLSPQRTSRLTRAVAWVCATISSVVPARIICSSRAALETHRALGYCADKLSVVTNGFDVGWFKPDSVGRARLRAAWGIPEGTVLLGMVGRWDPQKGHATLIEALGLLAAAGGPVWKCVFIGPGMDPANQAVTRAVTALGLGDEVRLIGPSAEIPAVMSALDVHVLASNGESFGNVTAEAMACGTPAVVTSVGAGPLLVGETGWVVPPQDPRALASALAEALIATRDRPSWQRRQAEARRRIESDFGIYGMVARYRKIWQAAP